MIPQNGKKVSSTNKRGKYIAFNHGELLPDLTLAWIIDAALRGKMTPSGRKLLLIPDTRKGHLTEKPPGKEYPALVVA